MVYHLEDVRFAYQSAPVLQGLSIRIQPGEFIALVGPNGAGKSTLLKILAGLLRRYEGTADFLDQPIRSYTHRQLAQKVAFVPQETHVVFPFTVGEIIMMGRLPHNDGTLFESHRDIDRAHEAMELTDTTSLAKKTFNQLSGGERQRVVLASALAQDPEVLLLDEPTVYLDLKHQIQFYSIVERLNSAENTTVVSVTHDVNLAARFARRMIAICDGRFKFDGPPESVLTPENLYDIFEISASVCRRPDGRGAYVVPES